MHSSHRCTNALPRSVPREASRRGTHPCRSTPAAPHCSLLRGHKQEPSAEPCTGRPPPQQDLAAPATQDRRPHQAGAAAALV